MIHVDPASPEFEKLPRDQQANILRHQFDWTVPALAEEYGVTEWTIRMWTDPAFKRAEMTRRHAYRQSEKGKQTARDYERRYRESGRRAFVRSSMEPIL